MAAKTKSRLRFEKLSHVFFHVFMYFQFSKKVVDQIFKYNIVLIERYITKCPNVSEKSYVRDINKYFWGQWLHWLVIHILENYGMATFFPDIRTFWNISFKQNNIAFKYLVDNFLWKLEIHENMKKYIRKFKKVESWFCFCCHFLPLRI